MRIIGRSAVATALTLIAAVYSSLSYAEKAGALQTRVTRFHVEYVVNADGSFTETTDYILQLATVQAVHANGQMPIPHSSSLDKFKVLNAKTIKHNGREVLVSSSSIFVQDGLIGRQGSFQDLRTTVVAFPELEAGDSIAVKTERIRHRPEIPAQFSTSWSFTDDTPYDDVRITVTNPSNIALHINAPGMKAETPAEVSGRTTRRWVYKTLKVSRTTEGSVDPLMYRPSLMISTFPSYEALGNAVASLFNPKAVVTPAIQAKASEIIGSAKTAQERADRILRWVSKNIRYFAVVLGAGGITPRSADDVLATRYGDCKDHVVLMQALLSAIGIRSQPALIDSGSLYELPGVVLLGAFNHVITYLPDQRLFLESTTPNTSYGVLPWQLPGKPVVLLAADSSAVSRVPVMRADNDVHKVRTTIRVAGNGSASGEDIVTGNGPTILGFAGWYDSIVGEDPVQVTRQILLSRNLVGDGTVSAEGEGSAFKFTLQYELPQIAEAGRNGIGRFLPPLEPLESQAKRVVSDIAERDAPYSCASGQMISSIAMIFPPGTRIELPESVQATEGARTYKATYRREASTLYIEREYASNHPLGYCPPADLDGSRALHQKILKDINQTIHYTPPLGSVR